MSRNALREKRDRMKRRARAKRHVVGGAGGRSSQSGPQSSLDVQIGSNASRTMGDGWEELSSNVQPFASPRVVLSGGGGSNNRSPRSLLGQIAEDDDDDGAGSSPRDPGVPKLGKPPVSRRKTLDPAALAPGGKTVTRKQSGGGQLSPRGGDVASPRGNGAASPRGSPRDDTKIDFLEKTILTPRGSRGGAARTPIGSRNNSKELTLRSPRSASRNLEGTHSMPFDAAPQPQPKLAGPSPRQKNAYDEDFSARPGAAGKHTIRAKPRQHTMGKSQGDIEFEDKYEVKPSRDDFSESDDENENVPYTPGAGAGVNSYSNSVAPAERTVTTPSSSIGRGLSPRAELGVDQPNSVTAGTERLNVGEILETRVPKPLADKSGNFRMKLLHVCLPLYPLSVRDREILARQKSASRPSPRSGKLLTPRGESLVLSPRGSGNDTPNEVTRRRNRMELEDQVRNSEMATQCLRSVCKEALLWGLLGNPLGEDQQGQGREASAQVVVPPHLKMGFPALGCGCREYPPLIAATHAVQGWLDAMETVTGGSSGTLGKKPLPQMVTIEVNFKKNMEVFRQWDHFAEGTLHVSNETDYKKMLTKFKRGRPGAEGKICGCF
eukprot:g942.t1